MATASATPDADDAQDALLKVAQVGLVTYGIIHLVIAWLTGQIAFGGGGGGGEASSTGALKTIAQEPFGSVLLWIIVVGMAALVLWQLSSIVYGDKWMEDSDRRKAQATHVLRAVIYGYLAFAAFKVVTGAGSSGGGSQEESVTAKLLAVPAGRVLVAAVGIGIIVAGVLRVKKGLDESFTEKLTKASPNVVKLGKAGYVAKGVTLVLVGGLFGWAALAADADKAGGMDQALATVRGGPFGTVILVLIALGLAAYGIFCFAWAKHPRP